MQRGNAEQEGNGTPAPSASRRRKNAALHPHGQSTVAVPASAHSAPRAGTAQHLPTSNTTNYRNAKSSLVPPAHASWRAGHTHEHDEHPLRMAVCFSPGRCLRAPAQGSAPPHRFGSQHILASTCPSSWANDLGSACPAPQSFKSPIKQQAARPKQGRMQRYSSAVRASGGWTGCSEAKRVVTIKSK